MINEFNRLALMDAKTRPAGLRPSPGGRRGPALLGPDMAPRRFLDAPDRARDIIATRSASWPTPCPSGRRSGGPAGASPSCSGPSRPAPAAAALDAAEAWVADPSDEQPPGLRPAAEAAGSARRRAAPPWPRSSAAAASPRPNLPAVPPARGPDRPRWSSAPSDARRGRQGTREGGREARGLRPGWACETADGQNLWPSPAAVPAPPSPTASAPIQETIGASHGNARRPRRRHARLPDGHARRPAVPHVGGPILPPGGIPVLIGGMPAARVGDMAVCVGPPDVIALGSFTVLIGGSPPPAWAT